MTVGIVGLGLIGGSMAKSIKARTAHTVFGCDLDQETMMMARMCGAIDAPLTAENLKDCDLVLVAIRPAAALLELASLPGGFCPAAAERVGYLAARGLPGVYAPEAAAAVIRRAIFRELDLEECP